MESDISQIILETASFISYQESKTMSLMDDQYSMNKCQITFKSAGCTTSIGTKMKCQGFAYQ